MGSDASGLRSDSHQAAPISTYDVSLQEKLERDARRAALLGLLNELEASDPTPADVRARAAKRVDAHHPDSRPCGGHHRAADRCAGERRRVHY